MNKRNYLLELETRRIIYNFILNHPGVYFRQISREVNIPKSTLEYQLKTLKKRELIVAKPGIRYTRYYCKEKISRQDKEALSILRKKTPLHICLFLIYKTEQTRKQICDELEKSTSTILFFLKKLIDMGIIEQFNDGGLVKYRLKDLETTDKLLIQYKEGLLDDLVFIVYDWCDFYKNIQGLSDLIEWVNSTDTEQHMKLFYEIFPHPYHV